MGVRVFVPVSYCTMGCGQLNIPWRGTRCHHKEAEYLVQTVAVMTLQVHKVVIKSSRYSGDFLLHCYCYYCYSLLFSSLFSSLPLFLFCNPHEPTFRYTRISPKEGIRELPPALPSAPQILQSPAQTDTLRHSSSFPFFRHYPAEARPLFGFWRLYPQPSYLSLSAHDAKPSYQVFSCFFCILCASEEKFQWRNAGCTILHSPGDLLPTASACQCHWHWQWQVAGYICPTITMPRSEADFPFVLYFVCLGLSPDIAT